MTTHQPQRVAQRRQELRVCPNTYGPVAQPDPGRRVDLVVVGEGEVDGGHQRVDEEHRETDEPRAPERQGAQAWTASRLRTPGPRGVRSASGVRIVIVGQPWAWAFAVSICWSTSRRPPACPGPCRLRPCRRSRQDRLVLAAVRAGGGGLLSGLPAILTKVWKSGPVSSWGECRAARWTDVVDRVREADERGGVRGQEPQELPGRGVVLAGGADAATVPVT